MTVYVQTTTVGTVATPYSMAEMSAMLGGTAAAPLVGGPRLVAVDVGGDTIALDVADIVDYSPSPFADELTIGDAAQVTDQAATGEDEPQRRDQSSRRRRGSRR